MGAAARLSMIAPSDAGKTFSTSFLKKQKDVCPTPIHNFLFNIES